MVIERACNQPDPAIEFEDESGVGGHPCTRNMSAEEREQRHEALVFGSMERPLFAPVIQHECEMQPEQRPLVSGRKAGVEFKGEALIEPKAPNPQTLGWIHLSSVAVGESLQNLLA
jgi:hypothetical protein